MFEDRIQDITEEVNRLLRLRETLESVVWSDETMPDMLKNIGNCYKYRNSYSCPRTDADYWWVYYKIIGVSPEDKQYLVEEFQECISYCSNLAKVEFDIRTQYPTFFDSGFIEIDNKEYDKERNKTIKRLKRTTMVSLPR